ncbi:Uu.00g084600.m01.CDS01 [Anthostomella pinea]|uniref:Uu.00g084600.m01.CDS01 n=1 Tax=Anthostomella pinea TaxID=933095 RepID=A0AAI8YHB3_9PEZI|nr:Uu.00g084600.m01.CDS01 [Anthostomella pinea]
MSQDGYTSDDVASLPVPLAVFNHEPLPPNLIANVKKDHSFHLYGTLDIPQLAKSATDFIGSNAKVNHELLEDVIVRFLHQAQDDCKSNAAPADAATITQSCWLRIRMTLPCDDWVEPRWHNDGRMFDCSCSEPRVPHSNPYVRQVRSEKYWRERSEVAARFAGCDEVNVERGQVIRFSWGQDDSPIHSEPDCTSDERVFMSVLFGKKDELRDMCRIREMVYDQVWLYP